MNERQKIYDEMCRVLTEWETQEAVDDDLYWMLVKIQNNWETVITANTEDVAMNRVDNITKFAQKKAEEQIAKENETMQRIEAYKEQIKALKPRIDELLMVGNACLEHGIKLEGKAWGGHEGYDTHQFISNSWSHLCGFISEYNQSARKHMPFTKVGKIGGGACNYNLTTDGVSINVSGDVEYVLKKFLDDFDTFETEFYNYVDKVTAQ
jgi:hypothetical protein